MSVVGYLMGKFGVLLIVFGFGCVYGLVGFSNVYINIWFMIFVLGFSV